MSVWNLSRIRLCCMKFWPLCLHPQCQTCMMLLEKFNGFLLNTFFRTLHLQIIDQILLSFSVFIYICIMILTFLKTLLSIVGSYYIVSVLLLVEESIRILEKRCTFYIAKDHFSNHQLFMRVYIVLSYTCNRKIKVVWY